MYLNDETDRRDVHSQSVNRKLEGSGVEMGGKLSS